MKKTKSKKKIIGIVLLAVLLLLIAGWWAFSVYMYDQNFNRRFTSYEPLMLRLGDFDGLERTKYEFPSDKGQMLTGYLYQAGEEPHGMLVIAHGLGAGHNSYMDVAAFFAKHGYDVFAYDATGNDESEGDGVGGIPQGVADLDRAISFVEESGNFPDLPVVLFGHSWGGYSACAVLNEHPEVKAVIECSGCNRSSDLFEAGGKPEAGNLIYTMMPFIKIHERFRYGKYAARTAMDGFAASNAAVLVLHSADDAVVPIQYGYDVFYEKYRDDPRFEFIRFEDRGHNYVYQDTSYIQAFDAAFSDWAAALDYDCRAEENKARFAADKAGYIRSNLDRTKWSGLLDPELFQRFLEFYDSHIG